jgi:Tfp pilus assembly protein PilF
MVRGEVEMPTYTGLKNTKSGSAMFLALAGVLLGLVVAPPRVQAQFGLTPGGRSTIQGSVMIDGETQPPTRVRVDVRAVPGGGMVTTFTDSTGRFAAPAEGAGSVIVTVQEQGYETVEQTVDLSHQGSASPIVITLRKLKARVVDRGGYTVSVHDLKVPAKARRNFEKGIERLQKKDVEGSLSYFKEATNAFPNYYEAYYQIGLANLELRRGNDAEQALQRSIDLSGGGYAEAQLALGALLCDRDSYPEAERVLRRAIDIDSNSWKGHFFLAQALFGQNRLDEAEKSAHEVLLRRSDVAATYILLANIHIRRHEYVLAVKDIDTYLSMRPDGPNSDQAREVRAAALRATSREEQQIEGPTIAPPQFVY